MAQKNTKWFLNIRYTIPSSVANQLKALIVWAIILQGNLTDFLNLKNIVWVAVEILRASDIV